MSAKKDGAAFVRSRLETPMLFTRLSYSLYAQRSYDLQDLRIPVISVKETGVERGRGRPGGEMVVKCKEARRPDKPQTR